MKYTFWKNWMIMLIGKNNYFHAASNKLAVNYFCGAAAIWRLAEQQVRYGVIKHLRDVTI